MNILKLFPLLLLGGSAYAVTSGEVDLCAFGVNQPIPWANISPGPATGNISGSANEVIVTGGTTSAVFGSGVTFTLPQAIATTSTPQFGDMGINEPASSTIALSI